MRNVALTPIALPLFIAAASVVGCGGDKGFELNKAGGVDGGTDASGQDGSAGADGGDVDGTSGDGADGDTCPAGFADCDQDSANGCEVELNVDINHCGSCENVCGGAAHSQPICQQGTCALSCENSFGDCDQETANGCEVALDQIEHCGQCDNVCPARAHADPQCEAGSCDIECHPNFADCDSDSTNGCETDTTSLDNCGSCGVTCGSQHASAACEATGCVLSCDADFADCNGNASDGCETDLRGAGENCGWCGHDCGNAPCVDGICEPNPIAFPEPGATGVAVDDTFVFWTAVGAQKVMRRPKSGGVAQEVLTGVARGKISTDTTHIVLGSTGEQSSALFRMAKNGIGNEAVVVNGISATGFAVDSAFVYWTDAANAVRRVANTGGTIELVADSQTQCNGVAVDLNHVYWGRWSDGSILRAQKTGGTVTTVASGAGMPMELAVDDTHVYWTDYNGRVMRAPIGGGTAETVADAQAIPWAIAIDENRIYWATAADGAVRGKNKAGGEVLTFATGLDYPRQIAVDSTHLYFGASGYTDPQNGGVWSAPK